MDLKIILLKFLIYKMAQEESWVRPVTTNGKYVNALLKNIHHWNSLEDLKLKIMLINEALDIPYEKNEELEKLKIKKLQELYEDIDYELLPDYYKRNKDIIMTWAKGPNLDIEQVDCNLIDKDVVLKFIDYSNIYVPNDIPNKFKKDKDVILSLLGNAFTSMGFYDDACEWMDISLENAHRAIDDIIATWKLLEKMVASGIDVERYINKWGVKLHEWVNSCT